MKTLEELEIEELEVREEMSELHDNLNKLVKKIKNIEKQKSNIKFGFEPSLEKICAIENWEEVAGKEYKKISKYLEKEHSWIYQSGYSGDTGQVRFSLNKFCNPGNDWEKIEYLLTLTRPDKNGEKIIDIMDANCSEFGSYDLVNGTKIIVHKYGRRSDVAEFGTIKEALEFIYKNLFVEKESDDDY
jgi:hypothetical protein